MNLRKGLTAFTPNEFPLLIGALEDSRKKLGFCPCGYVLMPDHWHALIAVHPPLTISRAVQDIKWISANRIDRSRHRSGPLWQCKFWDRFVRHEREFGQRLAYMHLNPVKKNLVTHPEDWVWSSYNNFALDKALVAQCPIRIDYVDLPTP
ncbi:MAG: transposase [Acidobacteria bacterium]|nr:transposase [Acidobacteriota bacterium]